MTFTRALSTNNYGPSKFIVDGTTTANGTHSTIATALTSASSGDTIFIRPGTYTENITLKAGVNLCAYLSDASDNATGKVIINGTATLTAAGSVTIAGIQLQTNSAALLAVTGSAASIVNLCDCYLNCSNNTGITFSSSSSSAAINIFNCKGNLGTTGIAYFSHSSAGTLEIRNCAFTNTGGSTTNNTCSSGVTVLHSGYFNSPITTSGTGDINISYLTIDVNSLNTTCVTHGGSGSTFRQINNSRFLSGTASAISVGATLSVKSCGVNSSNTNAITGTGTLNYTQIFFSGTSSALNSTLTLSPIIEQGGVVYWIVTQGQDFADATTYYLEQTTGNSPTASTNRTRRYITKNGTIRACYGLLNPGTAGSNQNTTLAIRVNDTTNYNVSTTIQLTGSVTLSNNTMAAPVVAGDFIDFILITPTWTTNPLQVTINLAVLVV